MDKKKKIAFFVNNKNIIQKDNIRKHIENFSNIADIFITSESKNSMESLGLDIEASYFDYDYIIYINPWEIKDFEYTILAIKRQQYYLDLFFENSTTINNMIKLLEDNKFQGLLTPIRDYLKTYNNPFYTTWNNIYNSMKTIFLNNSINVSISKENSPIVLENGCAIIKTKALSGIEKIDGLIYSPEFLSFFIPLYIQKNIFLPAYIIKKDIMINNFFGENYLLYDKRNNNDNVYLKMPSRKIFKHFIYKFLSTITFGKSKQKLKQKSKKYNYYIKIS